MCDSYRLGSECDPQKYEDCGKYYTCNTQSRCSKVVEFMSDCGDKAPNSICDERTACTRGKCRLISGQRCNSKDSECASGKCEQVMGRRFSYKCT